MITAVYTDRRIENDETGLDIVVPDFILGQKKYDADSREVAKVVYHIVVTARLSKKSKNSDEDDEESESDDGNDDKQDSNIAVHFAINKKFTEFEKLRNNLDKNYSGTFVPALSNSSNKLVNKINLSSKAYWKECREKQVALDKFMKWCASTVKIAKSPLLTEFLGLNQLKVNTSKRRFPQYENIATQAKVYEAEDLFEYGVKAEDDNGELFSSYSSDNAAAATSDLISFLDTTDENKQKVGLFSAKEDLTGHVSAGDDKFIIFKDEEKKENLSLTNKHEEEPDEFSYLPEGVNDIVAKLKDVHTTPKVKEINRHTLPSPESTTYVNAFVSVDAMEKKDLLSYIQENDVVEDDEVDLGF